MGVSGLWDLLRPSAASATLHTLSREAFLDNKNGLRALTIGIDASIWIFHAAVPQHGENPFLRTIFFKITALLQHPVLPVFVFDGPNKPAMKRNQKVGGKFGTHDYRSKQFKALLDTCGLEWWNLGSSSPTLSGSLASSTKNNSSAGSKRDYDVYTLSRICEEWAKEQDTKLTSEESCTIAMVWIALLSGGDYTPEGLYSIGHKISYGLAKIGLSDYLKEYSRDKQAFLKSLPELHARMVEELRTNSCKQQDKRYPDRSNKLSALSPSQLFPMSTLDAYLSPCTSPLDDASQGWPGFGQGSCSMTRGRARCEGRGDMEGMAAACEKYFEWGTKDLVCKKFAGESVGVFGAEIMNAAREAVRARDSLSLGVGIGSEKTPSKITSFFQQSVSSPISSKSVGISRIPNPSSQQRDGIPAHIVLIHSERTSKDGTETDYRISFRQDEYVERCRNAMLGIRVDPSELPQEERDRLGLADHGDKDYDDKVSATQTASKSEIRVWLPQYLVRMAWPDLVKDYDDKLAAKTASKSKTPKKKAHPVKTNANGKAKKGRGKKALEADGEDVGAFTSLFSQRPKESLWLDAFDEEEEQIEPTPPRSMATQEVIDLSLSPSPSPPVSPTRRSANKAEKKKLARPALNTSTSSTPSSGEKGEDSSRTVRHARKKIHKSSSPLKTIADLSKSSSPPERSKAVPSVGPRFSNRTFRKTISSPSAFPPRQAQAQEVIDLCSSSEEDTAPAKPIHRTQVSRSPKISSTPSGILSGSSKANIKSPRSSRSTSVSFPASSSDKPSSRSPREGSILSHPLLSGSSQPSLSPPLPMSPNRQRSTSPKKVKALSPVRRRPKYKIISSTKDSEVIDCTMRR
ncbi:hypothetical protein I305_06223 [Cryptococcus gattii E566]|uniref:XPG N-terminal domain-containing protein n=2 Tax=Cryptococcus gattii TaxID=37769 RepID=E6R166_CRYGW|nr:Hypothetical protein CGB_B6350W [Cryptococcus gattii WM276]ADV20547.1 Hypothetical protein CGB_B6350W [Cryptococcus gattii WM276]KIR76946.1 hypothetical protein I306_06098 [Cryptococcus gattii EJB2]KIY31318.1 hypothetical protein I305_06223 [Cryptococcus gattii E566]KJE01657.1 hypothetical protein I311_04694 [Cryptococcus gattii NT-10]